MFLLKNLQFLPNHYETRLKYFTLWVDKFCLNITLIGLKLGIFIIKCKKICGAPCNRPQQQQQSEPECKTEYQTISEIVYEEYNEQVCKDTTRHIVTRITHFDA